MKIPRNVQTTNVFATKRNNVVNVHRSVSPRSFSLTANHNRTISRNVFNGSILVVDANTKTSAINLLNSLNVIDRPLAFHDKLRTWTMRG